MLIVCSNSRVTLSLSVQKSLTICVDTTIFLTRFLYMLSTTKTKRLRIANKIINLCITIYVLRVCSNSRVTLSSSIKKSLTICVDTTIFLTRFLYMLSTTKTNWLRIAKKSSIYILPYTCLKFFVQMPGLRGNLGLYKSRPGRLGSFAEPRELPGEGCVCAWNLIDA